MALIKERLLNNYIVSLPTYARSIDAAVSILLDVFGVCLKFKLIRLDSSVCIVYDVSSKPKVLY